MDKQDKFDSESTDEDVQFFVVDDVTNWDDTPQEEKRPAPKRSVSTKRRVYHNEIERQRRNKINTWITELGQMILEKDHEGPPLSKIQILERTCEFVEKTKKKNKKMKDELQRTVCENRLLKYENEKLKKELKKQESEKKV